MRELQFKNFNLMLKNKNFQKKLALNWYHYQSERIDRSDRRRILKIFDRDLQFFPSMHDICEGLTEAKFDSNIWASNVEAKDHFDLKMDGLIELFQLTTLKNRHDPLTPKIL